MHWLVHRLTRLWVLGVMATTTSCLLLLGVEEETLRLPPEEQTACEPGVEVGCYSGPEGTEEVGICRGGTAICNAEGTGHGVCAGEVTPGVEDCANPEDEDCSGLACSQPLWSKLFGDVSRQEITASAVDAAGAIYVAGSFQGSIDLGGGPMIPAGISNFFIAKLHPDGGYAWSRQLGDANADPGIDLAIDLVVDSEGNVTIGGTTMAEIVIDDVTLPENDHGPEPRGYVIKFNAEGAARWGRVFDDPTGAYPQGQFVRSIALDPAGHVIVAGSYQGEVDFGLGPSPANGFNDVILLKLDRDSGSTLWHRTLNGMASEYADRIATDSSGNFVIVGRYSGDGNDITTNDGYPVLPAPVGGANSFAAKFDPDGAFLWAKPLGPYVGSPAGDVDVPSIAIDSSGRIIMAGGASPGADLGGGPLAIPSEYNAFLAMFSPGGVHLMSKAYGGSAGSRFTSVSVDSEDDLVLTGSFQEFIDFGSGGTLVGQRPNLFLTKIDMSGTHIWSKTFGGQEASAWILAAAQPTIGTIVTAGAVADPIDFGSGTLTPTGSSDAFVATFAP